MVQTQELLGQTTVSSTRHKRRILAQGVPKKEKHGSTH